MIRKKEKNGKRKNEVLEDKVLENKVKDYLKKVKEINDSLKEHLSPAYRKQHNIKRFISCYLLFLLLRSWVSDSTWPFIIEGSLISVDSIYPLIHSIVAWKFWHYGFWSFQGGVIDNLSKSIIYIGSIWAVLGKIFLQNFVVLIWIALIAPFSGILTWRKAVKHGKYLYIDNDKNNVWD